MYLFLDQLVSVTRDLGLNLSTIQAFLFELFVELEVELRSFEGGDGLDTILACALGDLHSGSLDLGQVAHNEADA